MDAKQEQKAAEEKKEPLPPTIIEQYPFRDFCQFLERVSKQSKSNKKRALLEELWKKLKQAGGTIFKYLYFRQYHSISSLYLYLNVILLFRYQ